MEQCFPGIAMRRQLFCTRKHNSTFALITDYKWQATLNKLDWLQKEWLQSKLLNKNVNRKKWERNNSYTGF